MALGARVWFYGPFVSEFPVGCRRVSSLEELFGECPAISLYADLTPATWHSVDARLLARLPDHGVIVNTARGGLIDQAALFAELASGQLRAGLDTIDDDWLPPDHPALRWPNLILTGHRISSHRWRLSHEFGLLPQVALDNIDRYLQSAPCQFVMDEIRYERST